MKKIKKSDNQLVVEEIQRLAAGLDVVSSLLTEVKAGSKPGKTFVLLLNLFLQENSCPDSGKIIKSLSLQNLAEAMNMDCRELTDVLIYLNDRGLIKYQPKY